MVLKYYVPIITANSIPFSFYYIVTLLYFTPIDRSICARGCESLIRRREVVKLKRRGMARDCADISL